MQRGTRRRRKALAWLCVALVWASLPAGRPQSALAQTNDGVEAPALQISSTGSALRVQWDAQGSGADSAAAGPLLALQPYGDYLLPVQTVGVLLSAEAAAATAYAGVTAQIVDVPWQGELAARPALQPPVLDWEPPVAAAPQPELPVPSQPFFLLRSGRMRGQSVAVYAFSEVFRNDAGELRRVVAMDLSLPGATLLSGASLAGIGARAAGSGLSGECAARQRDGFATGRQGLRLRAGHSADPGR